MSGERLDKQCHIPVGTRDAIHVPFVVVEFSYGTHPDIYDTDDNGERKYKPGDWVKFTDDKFLIVQLCDRKESHGMINPFIDEVTSYDPVVIILKPGITSPVRHHFEINPKFADIERRLLEIQLEQERDSDPACAECWVIKNGEVTRM